MNFSQAKRLLKPVRKVNIARLANLVILIVVIWSMANLRDYRNENKVIVWDVIDYYAYLPAAFIYHDLTLQFTADNPDYFSNKIWGHQVPDSPKKVIKMTMGMSVMYAPFFLTAQLITNFSPVAANGFTWPYKLALMISSVFYLMLGLCLLRKLLSRYFSQIVTTITLIAVFAGTNLYYYAIYEAPMSHVYNFTLLIAFITATINWYKSPTVKNTIITGFLAGIISLIRPSNIIILVFFIFYGVSSFHECKERFKLILSKYYLILLMILVFLLIWAPQLWYWKSITGHWFYYSYGNEGFFFNHPQFIKGLFSYRKGWLLYTPVMSFAVIGIFFLWQMNRKFFLPVLIFTIVNMFIIFSWWTWWYGGSFGQRPMIDSYGLLAIPFAAFTHYVLKSRAWIKITILSVMLLLVSYSVFQSNQYHYGAIHWDSMSKSAYWDSFLKLKPSSRFYQLIEEPDYEMAKKGYYVTKEKNENLSKENMQEQNLPQGMKRTSFFACNAENTNPDGTMLTGNNSKSLFGTASILSAKHALSGKFAVCLNKNERFGFTHAIILADSLKHVIGLKVMRYGSSESFLVVSATEPEKFYKATGKSFGNSENGWESMELVIEIPENIDTLKTYVWNKGNKTIYFDDFSISIYSSQKPTE